MIGNPNQTGYNVPCLPDQMREQGFFVNIPNNGVIFNPSVPPPQQVGPNRFIVREYHLAPQVLNYINAATHSLHSRSAVQPRLVPRAIIQPTHPALNHAGIPINRNFELQNRALAQQQTIQNHAGMPTNLVLEMQKRALTQLHRVQNRGVSPMNSIAQLPRPAPQLYCVPPKPLLQYPVAPSPRYSTPNFQQRPLHPSLQPVMVPVNNPNVCSSSNTPYMRQ